MNNIRNENKNKVFPGISPVHGVADDDAGVDALGQQDRANGPEPVGRLGHVEAVAAAGQALVEPGGHGGVPGPGGPEALLGQLGQGLAQPVDEGRADRVVIGPGALVLEAVPVPAEDRHVPVVDRRRGLAAEQFLPVGARESSVRFA